MIEGNADNIPDLKKTGIPFEQTLVGKAFGNVTYYRLHMDGIVATGNSVFKENTHFFKEGNYEAITAPLRPIDDIVSKRNVGPFDMMKIDVQGSEVPALKGSVKTLSSIEVIVSECSVMNYNQGYI